MRLVKLLGAVVIGGVICVATGQWVHAHQGAGFRVKGEGAALEFDAQAILASQYPGYMLMKEHCTVCHSQERIVRHLQNNIDKGSDYETNLKALILRKIRMSSGGVTKADGKVIIEFLVGQYQLELQDHAKRR